jgi:hypothetical protein
MKNFNVDPINIFQKNIQNEDTPVNTTTNKEKESVEKTIATKIKNDFNFLGLKAKGNYINYLV